MGLFLSGLPSSTQLFHACGDRQTESAENETWRGLERRLIGGRFRAINRDGAARTLRAQKQLTWPAAPVRSTRQQRLAQAPDEASQPIPKSQSFPGEFWGSR